MQLDSATQVGTVVRVDTGHVRVSVDRPEIFSRLSVASLVAIAGSHPTEWLVASVDRVIREAEDQPIEDGEPDLVEAVDSDRIRAVLLGTFRSIEGETRSTFRRGTDSFPRIDRPVHIIEGDNLRLLMGCLTEDIPDDEKLTVGHYAASSDAIATIDGNRLFQRHAALRGSTGTGKSWTAALILERASALKYPNIIVLDMHGEYAPLGAEGGLSNVRTLKVAGPGDLGSERDDLVYLPHWLLNQEEMLALLLDRSDNNAPNQAARFSHHVRELKRATLEHHNQTDALSTFTVDSPIPYSMEELISRLKNDDEGMVEGAKGGLKQGPFHGRLSRFVSRLEGRADDRRHGFMFSPPGAAGDYEWLEKEVLRYLGSDQDSPGIKVIDFSEVPADVLPIVVGVLVRVLYDIQFWTSQSDRTPVAFICDEAHLYMPDNSHADSTMSQSLTNFEKIAKEGRKYGVSLFVVSQRPSDVSRTVLSQCNNFVVLRLSNDRDQAVVRRLLPDSMGGIVEVMPLLDQGEALFIGDALLLPTRVRLEPPTVQPSSATRSFWTEWQNNAPRPDALTSAVEAARRQMRIVSTAD